MSHPGAQRVLRARMLGSVPYREAWTLQRDLAEQRKAGVIDDTLLCLEHPPVVTLGQSADRASLKFDPPAYAACGIELVESDRGGDATFHGPGQAVVYCIIDLRPDRKDLRRYVRTLEQAMIDTCADYGLTATRFEGEPGVWLAEPWRKIGAIGARVSRWVTHHGLALNGNTDLSYFDSIVPCGITDKGVTSLERELGRPVDMDRLWRRLAGHLGRLFDRALIVDGEVDGPDITHGGAETVADATTEAAP